MREFVVTTDVATARSFLGFFLLIFGLPAVFCPAYAQEKADAATSACVPSDLAAVIVSEGHTVEIGEFNEEFKGKAKRSTRMATSDAVLASQDDRQKENTYSVVLKEARKGNPAAMVNVGVFSLAGWGTQSNAGAALYWLHAAADRGYKPAFYDLGILYFKGCGVKRDEVEAFHFFKLGAAAGHAAAQVDLGYFFERGLGTAQDHAAAAHWYRKAAEAGEAQAQFNLADLYLRGEGVPEDEAAAFGWFQKAAFQGHTGAQIMAGSMLFAGRGAPKDLPGAYFWIFAAVSEGDDRGIPTLRALESQMARVEIEEARARAESFTAAHKAISDVALSH